MSPRGKEIQKCLTSFGRSHQSKGNKRLTEVA
jgi:hypothetical protein